MAIAMSPGARRAVAAVMSPPVDTLATGAVRDPLPNGHQQGGPTGSAPLIRAMRSRDTRRAAQGWLDRFARNRHAAVAELVELILVVADVPSRPVIEGEDVQDRQAEDVVDSLVASLALDAAEHGADFSQHWLVSRDRGSARVRESFPGLWRDIAASAPCQALLAGLLPLLRQWSHALAECQIRSIRHVATVAGLQLVDGLSWQHHKLREFCSTAELQIQEAETQGAHSRLAALSDELQRTKHFAQELASARDAVGVGLLGRRTKDVDPEIRRSCFEALCRWTKADPETFACENWTRYLLFGLHDRDAKSREYALISFLQLMEAATTKATVSIQEMSENIKSRVLARCHDADAGVSAAAVRCATALASDGLLVESELDPIIDLFWDADAQRRAEAVTFVSCFVFSEDILDYPKKSRPSAPMPVSQVGDASARRRIQMLLQFLGEYADGHYQLVDRLVAGLWRRSSCLECWEALASLALPVSEHVLQGDAHTGLIHLMEAIVRQASLEKLTREVGADDAQAQSNYAEAVLDRASRALVPQIACLLEVCQAEPAAMRRIAGVCSQLLAHCVACRRGAGGFSACARLLDGHTGSVVAESLKIAFTRQPDPEALEHIAAALAHLLDLAEAARPIVRDLSSTLRNKVFVLSGKVLGMQELVGGVQNALPPDADSLLATLLSSTTRLRILAKAYDVSLCELRQFCAALLGLLEDRVASTSENHRTVVNPQLAIALFELLVLILTRHTAALLQPAPLALCVMHDPVNLEELELLPAAFDDLCGAAAILVSKDPDARVRVAALASSIALLTGWWNARTFARVAGSAVTEKFVPSFGQNLELGAWQQLGSLLIEANSVPVGMGGCVGCPEPGDHSQLSAFSQLFSRLQQGATATSLVSDNDHVQVAVLTCSLVAACRHESVASSSLPALVLSQALSPREDLQQVAWNLLGRLRKEAQWSNDRAEAFFLMLLRSVQAVHRDAGQQVAHNLSSKLLLHVVVGRLAPTLQEAMLSVLRGTVDALFDSLCSGDAAKSDELFLEALVPWISRRCVADAQIGDLAAWAAQRGEAVGLDIAERAGLPAMLEACFAVASRNCTEEEPRTPGKQLLTPTKRDKDGATPVCSAKRRNFKSVRQTK